MRRQHATTIAPNRATPTRPLANPQSRRRQSLRRKPATMIARRRATQTKRPAKPRRLQRRRHRLRQSLRAIMTARRPAMPIRRSARGRQPLPRPHAQPSRPPHRVLRQLRRPRQRLRPHRALLWPGRTPIPVALMARLRNAAMGRTASLPIARAPARATAGLPNSIDHMNMRCSLSMAAAQPSISAAQRKARGGDVQRQDGSWQRQSREIYDRGSSLAPNACRCDRTQVSTSVG